MEITPVKSNYAPVKSKISTSPSSSFVLSAETQRFAVTDSHPYAFSFFPTPSEYGSNFKRMESACPSSNLFFEKLFAAVTNSNNIALFENLKLCKYAA